jgi:hypothetical protein
MATVSLIDPYSQQREEIARRQRMAQALQEQGLQVLEMPTTPGVTISPYAGLAKMLQTGIGAYQEKKARDDYTKLQNEYRTNYNTQLGEMARLISAPEIKGVAGQQAIEPQASVQEPIYATKPENLTAYGSGMGTQQDKDKILGWETTVPRIAGQPAIAPVEAQPAGYISPKALEKFDIPEVKQLAMAKYLAQFEPKAPIKGSPGDVFFDPTTGKERFKVPAAAGSTTLSPLGRLQAERDAIFAINPKDPRLAELNAAIAKETKTETTPPSDLARLLAERAALAAKNPTDPNLATYDSLIAKNTQDQGLAFQREKYEYETANPGYSYERVKNPDGSETIQAINKTTGIARPVRTGTGQVLTSAAQEKTPIYSDVVRDGKIYKMDLNKPESKDNLIFVKDVTPDLEKVEVTTKEGFPAFRFFPRDELVKLGEIPMQAKGIFLDLAQAGQLPLNWREIPEISSFVRQYLINQAGGITPKFLADLDVRVKEAAARLGDQGIKFSATVPRADNYLTLGGAQSSNAAPAAPPAPAIAKAPPKINDVVVSGDKKFRFKGGDPNQQSNWVEVK